MPPRKKTEKGKPKDQGITAITVQGFKSIAEETTIEIRPLTILAGANSSGKSSIMQPILMLKQTLEAPYDPGPLMINGNNVFFSSVSEFISIGYFRNEFLFRFSAYDKSVTNRYLYNNNELDLIETSYEYDSHNIKLNKNLNRNQLIARMNNFYSNLFDNYSFSPDFKIEVIRERCFFEVLPDPNESFFFMIRFSIDLNDILTDIIHIPGVRKIPENRYYPSTTTTRKCPGSFNHYIGSFVRHWQENQDLRLNKLNNLLSLVGLNSHITAHALNQVQIELLVSRFPGSKKTTKKDLVNIADVGFGVSQVLPVLVALLAAEPGQLVYIEQPELHLHPRAQVAMAEVLVDAAKRGVKVVAETHSSSLLLGIQTAVAEGKISPDLVILHWFERQKNGVTKVYPGNLDEQGRFGDWPEDFGDVELKAQSRYLDASLK